MHTLRALAAVGVVLQLAAAAQLPSGVEEEIKALEKNFDLLIELATEGKEKGKAYSKTAEFCDRWGWRLSGTPNLNESTTALKDFFWEHDGMNVTFENATKGIPHWRREGLGWGERCSLVSPRIGSENQLPHEIERQQALDIKGLGRTVGTKTKEGIVADVLVVTDWQDLWNKRKLAKDKIVVYAVDWEGYTVTTKYRSMGASVAAGFGAVAALIRSAASFSIGSPHTGGGGYYLLEAAQKCNTTNATLATCNETHFIFTEDFVERSHLPEDYRGFAYPRDAVKIPHAGLAVEDSDMLARMAKRPDQQPIVINLTMGGENYRNAEGWNTVIDIKGTEKPDEIVLVSGHIDSWDVGQGAMDDVGPAFVAQQALAIIKASKLKPKRTLRWVGWTTEEFGSWGGRSYYSDHSPRSKAQKSQFENETHSLVMELDNGIWRTQGIRLAASAETAAIMERVGQSLGQIDADKVVIRDINAGSNGLGIDVRMWPQKDNVPCFALAQQPNNLYHSPVNVDGYWDWEADPKKLPEQFKVPEDELHFQGDYFFFHHTEGDTMTVLDSAQMDKAAATVAVHAYAAAMLSEMMPRGEMLEPRPPQENIMQRIARAMESPTLAALVTGILGLLIGAVVGRCTKKPPREMAEGTFTEMEKMLPDE